MLAIKTQQRYKCDFCKKKSIKSAMLRHEIQCYRNPNRVCQACNNTGSLPRAGYWSEDEEEYDNHCPYCKKFDEQMLKEIEAREAQDKLPKNIEESLEEINF